MDVYSTPILSGVIDLTRPEQYGHALPLRESVLVGEEIDVVFTEPVRCEAFDLLVTVDNIGVELDRNDPPIQIVCDGRKVGFQIDPTQINVEDWIGMSFTVEIGKINTGNIESKSNVFDLNGNGIERNVKFEKTFTSIDLNQASTSFTVILNNMTHCSNLGSQMCSDDVKNKITTLLMLNTSDQNRIEVESVSQESGSTVSARIKMLPSDKNTGRMLRQGKSRSMRNVSNTIHAVGLFRELLKAVEEEQSKTRMLAVRGADSRVVDNAIVSVSDMKILPGESDMELVKTDPEMQEEEEELYRYGLMKDSGGSSQSIMSKVERQAIVEEIDSKSKNREEAMLIQMNEMKEEKAIMNNLFRELKENGEKSQFELKMLRFEFMVLSFACIGISLFAYLSLKRR